MFAVRGLVKETLIASSRIYQRFKNGHSRSSGGGLFKPLVSSAFVPDAATTPPWRAPLQRRGIGTTSAACSRRRSTTSAACSRRGSTAYIPVGVHPCRRTCAGMSKWRGSHSFTRAWPAGILIQSGLPQGSIARTNRRRPALSACRISPGSCRRPRSGGLLPGFLTPARPFPASSPRCARVPAG